MSPKRLPRPPSPALDGELRRLWLTIGLRVREERIAQRRSVADLGERAGVSRWLVYLLERGQPVSVDVILRLSRALGLRLHVDLLNTPRRRDQPARQADLVHASMGEREAGHLRPLGFGLGLDEPYQHFQFAGRADVAAWDLAKRALLHIENRTRFPDFQEMAGSYNAKRTYLADVLAARLGIRRWASQTHVIAGLWSSEVLHALRLHPESFRALCPDDPDSFAAWWNGAAPTTGNTSLLIVLDPSAGPRQPLFIGLEEALSGSCRPRYRGYADAAASLKERAA
jgi:transcriptional regulator with XRE-family HTH domain